MGWKEDKIKELRKGKFYCDLCLRRLNTTPKKNTLDPFPDYDRVYSIKFKENEVNLDNTLYKHLCSECYRRIRTVMLQEARSIITERDK